MNKNDKDKETFRYALAAAGAGYVLSGMTSLLSAMGGGGLPAWMQLLLGTAVAGCFAAEAYDVIKEEERNGGGDGQEK